MTDLHTHILPYLDDGAKDENASISMLMLQKQQCVNKIAMTSHFDCEEMDIDTFLIKRADSYGKLISVFDPALKNMQIKLGSEVRYSPNIRYFDYQMLCLEGTNLLLLELPTNFCPPFLNQTLYEFRSNGVLPLIAHVERYSYVLKNPSILNNWIENGAYIQVNANSLLGSSQKKWVLKMMQWGLVHVICSDTHSPDKRPPRIKCAMKVVENALGISEVRRLQRNADDLFRGVVPIHEEIHRPKCVWGFWL